MVSYQTPEEALGGSTIPLRLQDYINHFAAPKTFSALIGQISDITMAEAEAETIVESESLPHFMRTRRQELGNGGMRKFKSVAQVQ